MPQKPKKQSEPKFRGWEVTTNNPTKEDYDAYHGAAQSGYVVYGRETGENGTFHLQGCVYYTHQRTFSAVKKSFPRSHISVARDLQKLIEYCKKDNDFEEFGSPPEQGKRTDLDAVRDMKRMADVLDVATSYQSVRMVEKRLVYTEEKRLFKPQVIWFYGPPGTGKTHGVYECFPDVYTPKNFKWWEGYDAHENVIIDDFRKEWCQFHELLLLIDRYPYRVEFKGGSRQLLAKRIFITSTFHPCSVYDTREDVQQLMRRIDRVILVRKDENGNEIHEFM